MHNSTERLCGKIILFCVCVLFTRLLFAQSDAEKATRETDLLRPEEIEKKLKEVPKKPPEIKPKEAPAKKEEEKFFVKKIKLVGTESFPPQEFQPILEKYKNREVTLSELEILAREIEREYLRRGILAAVFLPEQEIKDQTVTLQVVEAKMGELKIEKHPFFRSARLRRYWQLSSGDIMRYDKISRSIQLMNKNPDRQVRAALMAGEKPETTDVLLTAQTNFPAHLTYTFDHEGIPSTGRTRTGFGIRHNNLLGLDDILLSGYIFGESFSGIYFYHSLPVNYRGTSLVYGYSRGESKPLKDYAVSRLKSEIKNTSISLHQDIFSKDEYLGEIFFGFKASDKTIKERTGVINRDKLRTFNLGGNFFWRGLTNTTSFSPEYTQGVSGLGATGHNNPLASRQARPAFSKLNLELQHKEALPLNLQAVFKFKSQVASRKLTPQEEFSLGGIDSVRGYPSGDFLADHGVLTSTELLIPAFFIPTKLRLPYAKESLRAQTTAVLFFDSGWGARMGALNTEPKRKNLLAAGAGIRFRLFDQLVLRLEWGFPLAANRPINETGHSRFHISIDFQEKLPEEIARIKKMRQAIKESQGKE